ncbi:MAG: nidogen-like domain-containing protein [bacterium]
MDAHAPAVSILTITIDDAGGDNNGILDPGETADVIVNLKNNGSGQVYGVYANISENDQYVSIDDDYSYFGFIDAGGGVANNSGDVFTVTADAECPLGYAVPISVTLGGDGGYAGSLAFNVTVGDRVAFFVEDFSYDQGWTGLGGTAEWEMGPAQAGGGDPSADHTPTSDNMILGNDIGGQYNNSISGTQWVYSPIIDAGSMSGVLMKYYHLLGVESSSYDHAYLEVYNGSSWVRLYENSATLQETEWIEENYDLGAIADSNANFQIRFGLGSTDGSQVYSGWNIDDIELKGYGRIGYPNIEMAEGPYSDSLQPGATTTESFWIKNIGEGTLRVTFSSDDTWLEFDGAMQLVAPADSLLYSFTINTHGLACGDHAGALHYVTNDNGSPEGDLSVDCHIFAPEMSIAETELTEVLESGQQSTYALTITNNGPGRLDYSVGCHMSQNKADLGGQAASDPLVVIEQRVIDSDKGDGTEPIHTPVTKGTGGPDAFGHFWIDSDDPAGPAVDWVDISAVGTAVTLGDDEATAAIPMGFGFPFYDNVYTQLYIGSNGIITFDGPFGTRLNVSLPTATVSAMIAMWWDDLDPRRGGQILYYHDVANNRFIVSFVDIKFYYSTTGTGSLNFQAVLDGDGRIHLNYATMDAGLRDLLSATVGLQNTAADDAVTMTYNAAYMHNDLSIEVYAEHWLGATPAGGSIDPYGSAVVSVNYDATDMEDGEYHGQVSVTCNDPVTPSHVMPVTLTVGVINFTCGDINGSETGPDIEDLVYLVNYMFSQGPPPPVMAACDVDGNGVGPDIADLVYLVAFMFSEGPALQCP